jgi:hypothetical protein
MKKKLAILAVTLVGLLAVLGGTFSDGDSVTAPLDVVATFSDGD